MCCGQEDICASLRIPSCVKFRTPVHRFNLDYEVRPKPASADAAIKLVASIIKAEFAADASGIVYCLSKKECEEVAKVLCSQHVKALHYHAGLDDYTRVQNHQAWSSGRVQVIVATVAFG